MRKNILFATLLITLVGAINYGDAQQVIVTKAAEANPAGGAITADNTDVAAIVRYIGTSSGGGEVTVNADGTITFTVATAADTTFECPVSGGLGGIIDVTNAACNTMGEVCDAVNGVNPVATTDFRCVLLDSQRADSSNNTLLAMSISTADSKAGRELFWATADALKTQKALVPLEARSIDFYLGPAPAYALKPFPFKNSRTFADFAWEDTSTCTGADTFSIIALNDYTFGSENPTFVYGPIATNTTTAVTLTLPQGGVFGKFGAKLLAREACASSQAGGLLAVSAYQIPSTH